MQHSSVAQLLKLREPTLNIQAVTWSIVLSAFVDYKIKRKTEKLAVVVVSPIDIVSRQPPSPASRLRRSLSPHVMVFVQSC